MSLSVQEVVNRDTPLEWFEAVAIVQAACAAALEDAATEPIIPDLDAVMVAPDGQVTLLSSPSLPGPAVRSAATLLSTLLPAATPVPLRLATLAAIATPAQHPSLRDFANALNYFERPNRREVVAGVYDRAATRPPAPPGKANTEIPAAQKAPPTTPTPARPRPWAARAVAATALALLVLVIAFAAFWWHWSPPPGQPKTVVAAVESALAGVGHAVGQIVPTALRRYFQTAAETAASATSPPTAEAFKTAPDVRARPKRRPAARAPQEPDEVLYLDGASPAARLYSAADRDVIPPVPLRRTLPTAPPQGVRPEELTRVEVVVNEIGEVESAKIVGGLRRAVDGMMLSAIKTWRFQPATKDGHAVAYRLLVPLTSF